MMSYETKEAGVRVESFGSGLDAAIEASKKAAALNRKYDDMDFSAKEVDGDWQIRRKLKRLP